MVCFVFRNIILELERAILATLFLAVQKTQTVGVLGKGICSVLFL
jgi:hypothetical protein